MTFANVLLRRLSALLLLLLLVLALNQAGGATAPAHAATSYPPSGPAAGPVAGPKPPLTGKVLYARNCVRCHGADGKAGINDAHDLTKSNLNAFGRTYLVTKGLGKMPAFEEYLSAKEIEAVVAYSLTLK